MAHSRVTWQEEGEVHGGLLGKSDSTQEAGNQDPGINQSEPMTPSLRKSLRAQPCTDTNKRSEVTLKKEKPSS